jgi:hypothetical protein
MARSTYSYILGACKCDLNFCCQKTWKYVKQEIGLKQRIYRRRRPGSGRDDLKRANGNWFVGSWGNNSLECLVSYFSTFSIHWDNRPFYKLYKLEWDYFWTWTTTQTWPFESFQNLSFLNTDTWKIHISTRINIGTMWYTPWPPQKEMCIDNWVIYFVPGGGGLGKRPNFADECRVHTKMQPFALFNKEAPTGWYSRSYILFGLTAPKPKNLLDLRS